MDDTERRVRLYPTGSHYIEGVRAVERLVPADVADRLLAFSPPAFTRERPEGQKEPSEDALESIDDVLAHPEFRPPEPEAEAEGTSESEGLTNG